MTAIVQPELPDIATVATIDAKGAPFRILALVEGLESGDGRMFELGTTTWRPTTMPFMVRDTAPHGPGQQPAPAWLAGIIDEMWRDPADDSRILGRGHLLPNDDGTRAEQLIRAGYRGVSIDGYPSSPIPPDLQITAVDQHGKPLDVLVRITDTEIAHVTLVPDNAVVPCCVWLDDEDMPTIAAEAHGAVIATDTEPQTYEITDPYEQLVASAGGPVNPPRTWFFAPEPDDFQPWQVTPDGHITGHIAREGQCHLGIIGECQTAPRSTTVPPYKAFHRTTARCDDDTEVACGWLTVDTKHNHNLRAPADATADHYDHTGTLAAKIRLSNGKHGIWASGALCPGLADRDVWILQGPEVSPDWRRWQDPDTGTWHSLELVATLAVPFPGYPHTRTRPELLVASGQIVAQFGALEPCDCDEGDPMTPEENAQIEARFARIEETLAIVASGGRGAIVSNDSPTLENIDEAISTAAHDFVDKNGDGKCDVCGMAEEMHGTAAALDDTAGDVLVAHEPLTMQERAGWRVKYDDDTRKAMAADGRAWYDGSFAIGDADDLALAVRAAVDNDKARPHVIRNAAKLGATDIIPAEWSAAEPVTVT